MQLNKWSDLLLFFDLDMQHSEKEILDTLVYILLKKDLNKRQENVIYSIDLKLLEKIESLFMMPFVKSYRFVHLEKYRVSYHNSNHIIQKENHMQKY